MISRARGRRLAAAAAAVGLIAGLAGCFPTPTPGPTVVRSAAVPSPTPLAVPAELPGEIARSTATPGLVRLTSTNLPRVRDLSIRVACSGGADLSVHYSLVPTTAGPSATPSPIGPSGDVACTGEATTVGFHAATPLPAAATLQLDPGAGVTAAYEILLRDPA